MPPITDLDEIERKLAKRGFRRTDVFLHDCAACGTHAVIRYGVHGKIGGRDIALCQACGVAQSWRSSAGLNERELDPAFDLRAFLA
jgi:hypothetical protein